MVAPIDYATNIFRDNRGTETNEETKFFDAIRTRLTDGTPADDVYNTLMKKEDKVLDTLNRVGTAYDSFKVQERQFWNMRIADAVARLFATLLQIVRMMARTDGFRVFGGMMVADEEFRICVGVWLLVATSLIFVCQ